MSQIITSASPLLSLSAASRKSSVGRSSKVTAGSLRPFVGASFPPMTWMSR